MNREHHLSYCKICTNRKINLEKGLICTLTNKIADFKDNCPSFNNDISELEKYRKRFELEVNDKYATNSLEKLISESSFLKPTTSKNPKYKSIDKTHNLNFKNDTAYDKGALIVMIFATIYIFFVNYKDITNSTIENDVLAGLGVMFLIICVFIYRAYFIKHKTKISITQKGIEYYGNKLDWNNIVDFGILKAKSTSVNEHKILVGTITKGIVEIDLTALNISPEEFINIMRLNTKNVLQQSI